MNKIFYSDTLDGVDVMVCSRPLYCGNIKSNTSVTIEVDANNDETQYFGITDGGGNTKFRMDEDANLGIGTTSFNSGNDVIAIANGTFPSSHVDNQIFIGSKDSAGTGTDTLATLALYLEEGVDATALDAVGTLTTRIPIWVNGTAYWLYLDPV